MSDDAARHQQTLIRASAGTGKTFQLSNRYLQLVAAGASVQHVLAATFARKAAGEIVDRVLVRLAEAVLDRDKLAALGVQLGRPQWSRRDALDLLRTLTGQLHRLRVGTLDSFFMQLAGSYSLELNLPPGWSILEEFDDAALRSEAVRALLESSSSAETRALLHLLAKGDDQRQVTAQILEVVGQLYHAFCDSEPSAWQRVPRRSPLPPDELTLALEAFEAHTDFPEPRWQKAHDKSLQEARANHWEKFLKQGVAGGLLGDGTYFNKPIAAAMAAIYQPLIDHAKAQVLLQFAHRADATHQLLEKFHRHYQALKSQSRGLRFDDVTRILAQAAEPIGPGGSGESGAAPRLDSWHRLGGHRLGGRVQHLLLDEFQDTALAQWRVLRPLALACTSQPQEQSFFCVGDVKQAIYGWRGGDAKIFDTMESEIGPLDVEPLTESYRSSQPIIDVVNRVFLGLAGNAALDGRPDVTAEWTGRFAKHSTALKQLEGYVCLRTARAAQPDEKPDAAVLEMAAAETARLATAHPGCTIGVLVRRNRTIGPLIYALRHRHGLVASEEGGYPIVDSPAVQVVLSLLTLADHPGDTVARFHVAHATLGRVVGFLDHADDRAAAALAARVRQRLLAAGYGAMLDEWARALRPDCDERDARRLQQLVELGSLFEEASTLRPGQFVEYVRTQKVEDPVSAQIRVMTIHQAKGLQFDIVVLPELDVKLAGSNLKVVVGRPGPTAPIDCVCHYPSQDLQVLFPPRMQDYFRRAVDDRVNESLCLLYVAMTRAVHELHMIVAPKNLKAPSRNQPAPLSATAAGVVRAALASGQPVAPDEVLYEHGQRDWQSPRARQAGAAIQAAPLQASPGPTPIALGRSTVRRRGLEVVAPSSLHSRPGIDLGVELRREGGLAQVRGLLVHAWLEAIEWLDQGLPPRSRLLAIARQFNVAASVAAPWADWLAERLDRPPLRARLTHRQCLERGERQGDAMGSPADAELRTGDSPRAISMELHRERAFAQRQGNAIVQGAIDRVVVWRRGAHSFAAEVLDFKTDRVTTPAECDQAVERHRAQIEAYCRAVAAAWQLDVGQVGGYLLLIEPGEARYVCGARDD